MLSLIGLILLTLASPLSAVGIKNSQLLLVAILPSPLLASFAASLHSCSLILPSLLRGQALIGLRAAVGHVAVVGVEILVFFEGLCLIINCEYDSIKIWQQNSMHNLQTLCDAN